MEKKPLLPILLAEGGKKGSRLEQFTRLTNRSEEPSGQEGKRMLFCYAERGERTSDNFAFRAESKKCFCRGKGRKRMLMSGKRRQQVRYGRTLFSLEEEGRV